VHVIQNNRTTLDLLGGVNYTREKYSLLPSRSFAAASLGEELSHKIGMNTLLTQKLYFFPHLRASLIPMVALTFTKLYGC
jgi:hypothetical protein